MNIFDLIGLSLRMFRTRPMRTLLTIFGVSLGIGAVLFLVSLGYGLQNTILDKITTSDSLLSINVDPGPSGLLPINQEAIDKFSKIDNVTEVSPLFSIPSQVGLGDYTADCLVNGVNPSYFRYSGLNPSSGNFFVDENKPEAVISSAGAKMYNHDQSSIIGQEVSIILFVPDNSSESQEVKIIERKEKYKIVGVIQDDNTNFVYLPLKSVADININSYANAKIRVSDSDSLEKVRSVITDMGFLASSLSDTVEQTKKIFKIVQIVLALFGLIALGVSAIGMFNTMTIALLERINEIGIMRSIGVSKRSIRALFVMESLIIGFLGGIFGVFIGYLAGMVSNFGLNILARAFGGQHMDIFYSPSWFVLIIIFFSTFIGLATGIYPSIKASRINPLDALRYK
jgi:putative ABC transport system permease protein